jgi:hypothetical protein
MNATQKKVEEFLTAYELAAQTLCDYWDGPVVDGVQYSEDDTEDLCNWVVSQGRDLWQCVVEGDIDIGTIASIISSREFHLLPVAIAEWTTTVGDPRHRGYQDPALIAQGVNLTRFGTDTPGG